VRCSFFLLLALNGSRSECVMEADGIGRCRGWKVMGRGEFLPWGERMSRERKKEETGRRSEFCVLWFVYGPS
jgi:hypothetical protein